jgi:hypothetical protein
LLEASIVNILCLPQNLIGETRKLFWARMKKCVLVAALVFVWLMGSYYYVTSYASPSTGDGSDVEGPSSGYLDDLQGNETKVFFVSASNPRYGVCSWNYSAAGGVEVHEGDPCFVVNVTVRNHYTTDPIWKSNDAVSGLYVNHVKLTVHLYDRLGRVDAVDVTYPVNSLHGGHVFVVEPEETRSVEVCLATDCRNIERYEVYVAYLGPAMEP